MTGTFLWKIMDVGDYKALLVTENLEKSQETGKK